MTLETIIPSLRSSLYECLERDRWPLTTTAAPSADLAIGGVCCTELARRFGTPTHLLDLADVRSRCRAYRAALPTAAIRCEGATFRFPSMAALAGAEGLTVDVRSAGELALVLAEGPPPDRVVLHAGRGADADATMAAAVAAGVGLVVVDTPDHLDRLAAAVARDPHATVQDVALRVAAEPDPGPVVASAGHVLARPELRLVGLDTDLGPCVSTTAPFERAAVVLLDLAAEVAAAHEVVIDRLGLGGGHDVTPGRRLDPAGFARRVPAVVARRAALHGLPAPALSVAPGDALVARAGVTLYRVVGTEHGAAGCSSVVVDAGSADLVHAAGSVPHLVGRRTSARWAPATVVGHGPGDVLARDVVLPADVDAGDLLAVPGTALRTCAYFRRL